MTLLLNATLKSWGRIQAHVKIINGAITVKSMELLEDDLISLNNGDAYLDHDKISKMDIDEVIRAASKVYIN